MKWNFLRTATVVAAAMILAAGCNNSNNGGTGKNTNSNSNGTSTDNNNDSNGSDSDLKILRVPIASDGPGSMDPADGSTLYDNRCISQIYETLLQYKYLKRPLELEPLLLAEMPQISDDGLTWTFKLKQGVKFQDDDCFPDGKGRELVTDDVFYSWKRLADKNVSIKNWWLIKDTIKGFDEYRETQNAAEQFDYEASVEGMKKIDDYNFQVILKEPVTRFQWTLAMFQLSIVPREAVEKYGTKFAIHPVGTGPFTLKEGDWTRGKNMIMNRNPNFREELYPSEYMPEDEEMGLTNAVGKKLPFVDRVETVFFNQNQPMWLEFKSKKLGFTTVPADKFKEAFNARKKTLRPEYKQDGISAQPVPLLDFIFYAFNMEDEVFGGYTPEKRALRKAIAMAIDWEERNEKFYSNICTIYDGMIPPGLAGYPADGKLENAWRGPDLEKAKAFLVEAGYPNGEGLPALEYYTSRAEPGPKMVEMTTRHLDKIGVKINPRIDDFSAMMESIDQKKAPFFSMAWHSDYPDAENNLALFYGPNEAPGANHFNYKNPEYDKLYEKIRTMPPSDERTKIFEQMRDMVIADSPYIGSMARVRYYLINDYLKNFKAIEDSNNWYKYLDVEK